MIYNYILANYVDYKYQFIFCFWWRIYYPYCIEKLDVYFNNHSQEAHGPFSSGPPFKLFFINSQHSLKFLSSNPFLYAGHIFLLDSEHLKYFQHGISIFSSVDFSSRIITSPVITIY